MAMVFRIRSVNGVLSICPRWPTGEAPRDPSDVAGFGCLDFGWHEAYRGSLICTELMWVIRVSRSLAIESDITLRDDEVVCGGSSLSPDRGRLTPHD